MKEDMNRLRLQIKRYEQIAINTVDEGRYEPIKIAMSRSVQSQIVNLNTVDDLSSSPD